MNYFTRRSSAARWLWALLLAFLMVACGGGGGSDAAPASPGTASSATGASGTLLPGAAAPATASGTSSPGVTESTPVQDATQVAVLTVAPDNSQLPRTLSATFSEPMNPATLASPATTFSLKETFSGISVVGTISMNVINTVATFTPAAALAPSTQFTATITTAATNAAGLALGSNYGWSFTTGQAPINLKTASSFLVLSGNSIQNISSLTNPTRVNGQLGIDPGNVANVTGFTDSVPTGTGIILTDGIQFGSNVTQAKTDLLTALTEANGRTRHQIAVNITDLASFSVSGGSPGVYPPGLYTSTASLKLNMGNMTLDAQGDPDAVWVFKAASGLTVGDTRQVVLLNGAKARNVFWTVATSAQIGDQVDFAGSVLAGTDIAVGRSTGTGTAVQGRVLSVSGLALNFTTVNAPAP